MSDGSISFLTGLVFGYIIGKPLSQLLILWLEYRRDKNGKLMRKT